MPDLMIILIRTLTIYFVVFLVMRFMGTTMKNDVSKKEKPEDNADNRHATVLDNVPVIPPKYRFETLPVPLIMDGKVQGDNLVKLDKNRFWLKSQLRQKGVKDTKDVFLCTIDHRGELYVSVK